MIDAGTNNKKENSKRLKGSELLDHKQEVIQHDRKFTELDEGSALQKRWDDWSSGV